MKQEMLFATATMYKNVGEVRFQMALKSVDAAQQFGYPFVIVDGSPIPEIAEMLQARGAIVYRQQTKGMGPGRRELVFYALEHCKALGIKVIQFTEPEKHDYIRFAAAVAEPILSGRADMVLSRRTVASRKTYPQFQQEMEIIMLAAYAKALEMPEAHSYLGPIAFSVDAARKYILSQHPVDYGIEDTYVQMYAPILALKDGVKVVVSEEFDFKYPSEQREEEEGVLDGAMKEKRTWQTKSLMDAFVKLTNKGER